MPLQLQSNSPSPTLSFTEKIKRYIACRREISPQLWGLEPERYPQTVESFRILKNRIIRFNEKEGIKIFLFTGVERKTGVSTISFNLSVICSQDIPERRSLLIDGNIAHPALHKSFGLAPTPGLLDHLYGEASLTEVINNSFFLNLDLLPLGSISKAFSSPFTLQSFIDFFEIIGERYEMIFIDTEPCVTSSHTQSICTRTDGVILIAEACKTRLDAVRNASVQLNNSGVRLLGSFLNRRRDVIPTCLHGYT